MADDVEVNADEGVIDKTEESEQAEEKTGFLKSKLFKIIAGVVVLLIISASAYFFLVVKKEPEETTSDTDAVTEQSSVKENEASPKTSESDELDMSTSKTDDIQDSDTTPPSVNPEPQLQKTKSELLESEKITTALQQQNAHMQQQINDLKAQINQKDMLIQQQNNSQNTTEIAPIRNLNSVDYQQDLFDDSSMREPNRTPPPKPSWGEFDRINKK